MSFPTVGSRWNTTDSRAHVPGIKTLALSHMWSTIYNPEYYTPTFTLPLLEELSLNSVHGFPSGLPTLLSPSTIPSLHLLAIHGLDADGKTGNRQLNELICTAIPPLLPQLDAE